MADIQYVTGDATHLTAGIHMPCIGTGLAGGRWDLIEPLIIDELIGHNIPVAIYDWPQPAPRKPEPTA